MRPSQNERVALVSKGGLGMETRYKLVANRPSMSEYFPRTKGRESFSKLHSESEKCKIRNQDE